MEKKRKDAQPPSNQTNVHPETQPRLKPGVPDESSSKRPTHDQQHDGRTGHDKDANQQQARVGRGRS